MSTPKPSTSALLSITRWPQMLLVYEGMPDFPAFESYWDDLLSSLQLDGSVLVATGENHNSTDLRQHTLRTN